MHRALREKRPNVDLSGSSIGYIKINDEIVSVHTFRRINGVPGVWNCWPRNALKNVPYRPNMLNKAYKKYNSLYYQLVNFVYLVHVNFAMYFKRVQHRKRRR